MQVMYLLSCVVGYLTNLPTACREINYQSGWNSAPKISDGTSGRQILSTCTQTWVICTGKAMLRLFHAEVAPSSHSL